MILGLAALGGMGLNGSAAAQTTLRVGWCARTVSSAAAPFAIAQKMGWFEKDGIKVELDEGVQMLDGVFGGLRHFCHGNHLLVWSPIRTAASEGRAALTILVLCR